MSAPADKRTLALDAYPPRLRVDQAATYLNCTSVHVTKLIRSGALQAINLSGPLQRRAYPLRRPPRPRSPWPARKRLLLRARRLEITPHHRRDKQKYCPLARCRAGSARLRTQHGIASRPHSTRQDNRGPGRDVFAYYNIEQPELLTVSDLDRQNFFTVKNHTLPAMSATREQFAAVNHDRSGHMRRAKEIYGNIQHPERKFVVRDNCIDEDTKELGRFHNTEVERFQQEKTATTRALGKIQRKAAASGVGINHPIRNPDRVLSGLELEQDARARIAAKEAAANNSAPSAPGETPGKKTYYLNPSASAAPSPKLYWILWAKVEKAKPGLNRHALTQRAIGCHPNVNQMKPDQLQKMIGVFSAILRDSKQPAL
jgi:hypothetical protein